MLFESYLPYWGDDRLKSITKGYASFDYELVGYEVNNLVKVSIMINGDPVDALSLIVHKDRSQSRGRALCERLKDLIPRQQFKVAIQAAIGGKIIARETIKGFKKDVLTKIHGGGATDRKRKLLEKQKKGKARSKQFGKVEIPQEAFIGVLKINNKTQLSFSNFFSILNNNLYADANIINSISIDGIQRIDEETIISYANVSKGDVYTEEIGNKVLKSLFETCWKFGPNF